MMEVIFAWYRFCFWFSIGQDAGFEVDFAIPSFCGMTAIAVLVAGVHSSTDDNRFRFCTSM